MARFLVELLINASGEAQVVGVADNVGKAFKRSSDSVDTSSLRTEASLRRTTEAAEKLKEQMSETKAAKAFVSDMAALNTKLSEQIAAFKRGPEGIAEYTRKQREAAEAQRILSAQVKAGVSAESAQGKQIAELIRQHNRYQTELDETKKKEAERLAQSIRGGGSQGQQDDPLANILSSLGPIGGQAISSAQSLVNLKFAFDTIKESGAGAAKAVTAFLSGLHPLVLATAGAAAGLFVLKQMFDATLGAALAYLKGVIAEGAQTQVIVEQLNNSLRSNGSYSGLSAAGMIELAESLAFVSGQSDDAIIKGELIASRYDRIGKDIFPRVAKAAVDMSRALGKSVEESFSTVSRIAAGGTGAVKALREAGVALLPSQKKFLEQLVEQGKLTEYQNTVLSILEEKLGGAAQAYGVTLLGSMEKVKFIQGEFGENIASEVIPSLEHLIDELVRAAGGWDLLLKVILDVGSQIGNAIRITVYGAIIQFREMQIAMDLWGIRWRTIVKEVVDFTLKIFGQMAQGLSRLPDALGGKQFQAAAQGIQGVRDQLDKNLSKSLDNASARAHAHALALKRTIQTMAEHRLALQGDTKVHEGYGSEVDKVGKAVKKTADLMSEWDKIIASLNAKLQDQLRTLTLSMAGNDRLISALHEGIIAYEQQLQAQARAAAVTQALTKADSDYRSELEKLNAVIQKMKDAGQSKDAAQKEAELERLKKGYTEYRKVLEGLAGAEHDRKVAVKNLESVVRDAAAADSLYARVQAELQDALTGTTHATRALAREEAIRAAAEKAAKTTDAEGIRLAKERAAADFDRLEIARELIAIERNRAENAKAYAAPAAAYEEWLMDLSDDWRDALTSMSDIAKDEMRAVQDAVKAGFLSAADGERALAQIRAGLIQDHLGEWGSFFGTLGSMFGGFFQKISNAINAMQQGQQAGNQLGSLMGASAGTTAALGYMGGTAAIFMEIYKEVSADIKRERARTWGDLTSVQVTGGQMSSPSYFDKNGRAASDALRNLLRDLVDSLGAVLKDLPEIVIRSRKDGKEFSAYVAGVWVGTFRDAQQALESGLAAAITQADFTSISREFATALRASINATLEEVERNIETARTARRARLGDTGEQYVDTSDTWRQEITAAAALGLAIDDMVSARNRELDAIKNSVLGIDTTVSDQLRALGSLSKGIEEAAGGMRATLEAQIRSILDEIARLEKEGKPKPGGGQGGGGPQEEDAGTGGGLSGIFADSTAEMDSRIADLRAQVEKYLLELDKIPKALSDQELSMGIFDALYTYLDGSKKYAEQAAKYARIKVEIEFATIRAQLILLGKWEEFAQMFDDAYKAALNSAGKEGRGGGGGRKREQADTRESLRDEIARMEAEALGPLHVALFDLQQGIEDFTERAKEAKLPAEEVARAVELMTKKFQEGLRDQANVFAGIGTDFTAKLDKVKDFFNELQELGRGKTGMPDWLVRLLEGKALDKLGAELDTALNQFMGIVDPMAAINSQADVLRQNVIAYGEAAGWTAEEIQAALDKVNAGVDYQRQSAINGIMGTLFDYLKEDAKYAKQYAEFKKLEIELQFRLIEAQLKALGAWDDATQAIFNDARKTALEMGKAAEVVRTSYQKGERHITEEIRDAIAAAVDGWRRGIAQFADQTRALMLNSGLTNLTQRQQLTQAQSDFQRILALAQGGDTEALSQLDQARQAYLQIARTMFGGGVGFDEIWREVMGESADLLAEARATEAEVMQAALQAVIDGANDNTNTLTRAVYDSAEMVAQAIYASFAALPQYAQGGVVTRPQIALVGEGGPEAVIPMRYLMRIPEAPRSSSLQMPEGAKILPFSGAGSGQGRGAARNQESERGGGGQADRSSVLALERLAASQGAMGASLRAIAESTAETARSNRSMASAERIRRMSEKRG